MCPLRTWSSVACSSKSSSEFSRTSTIRPLARNRHRQPSCTSKFRAASRRATSETRCCLWAPTPSSSQLLFRLQTKQAWFGLLFSAWLSCCWRASWAGLSTSGEQLRKRAKKSAMYSTTMMRKRPLPVRVTWMRAQTCEEEKSLLRVKTSYLLND